MESQQVQSNQATINRMKSQYGLAAYSSCTSNTLNVDTANPYTLATWLSYDEPCMASNKAKQAQQQIQCSAGYVLVNGSCESGNQGCVNKWGTNTIWTGTGCDCASGYKWGGSGNNQCVATTPTCTTNSTYNGSQCICNAGYSSLSGVCISNQAAISALHPTSSTVPTKTSNPHSSGLSTAQISSIISLLQAFGADASVIASVQVALGQ